MPEHLEMDFCDVDNVVTSWEKLRRLPDYEIEAGTILFTHLFDKCPHAKVLFGFPLEMDTTCDRLKKSKRFMNHAKHMIDMLDRAIHMLGPDAELLETILIELGKKHVAMGVNVDTFPIMGESLIETLREKLGAKDFSQDVECSWLEVYKVLSNEMIMHMMAEK